MQSAAVMHAGRSGMAMDHKIVNPSGVHLHACRIEPTSALKSNDAVSNYHFITV
jgi:hypothetical protein